MAADHDPKAKPRVDEAVAAIEAPEFGAQEAPDPHQQTAVELEARALRAERQGRAVAIPRRVVLPSPAFANTRKSPMKPSQPKR